MGKEIVYCAKCATRLLAGDFDKKQAFWLGNRALCKECAFKEAPGLTTEELDLASQKTPRGGVPRVPTPPPREALPGITPRSGTRLPPAAPPAETPTRRAVAKKTSRKGLYLVVGISAAGLLLFLILLTALLKSSPGTSPPSSPSPPPRKGSAPPPAESLRERSARQAYEKAFRYMKEKPGDLEGQIKAFEDAMAASEGTAYFGQARTARDALLERRGAELPRLEEQIRSLIGKEEFKAALEACEEARKRRDAPEWAAQVDAKVKEVRAAMWALLESVRGRAREDKRWGAAEEVRKARERVAKWGIPEPAADLDAFLTGIPDRRAPSLGLVAWWRLDGGSGTSTADSTGGGRGGTLEGGVEWQAGLFGRALFFDGRSGWVRMNGDFAQVRNAFTIALWANPTATRKETPEAYEGGVGTKDQRYAVFPCHGEKYGEGHAGVGLSIGKNGVTVFEHASSYLPPVLVHNGRIEGWTHVAVAYVNREPTLYIDGKKVKTGKRSGKDVHPSGDLGDDGEKYGFYAGGLDDVRVYDRALSDDEMAALAAKQGLWRPVFDGRTLDWMKRESRVAWKVAGGVLCSVEGQSDAAQTQETFGDGEFRARFEVTGAQYLQFSVRQGSPGQYRAAFEGPALQALEGRPHEIVFTCRGDSVTARLDGKPLELASSGNPRRGSFQFNGKGGTVRILSLEFREVK